MSPAHIPRFALLIFAKPYPGASVISSFSPPRAASWKCRNLVVPGTLDTLAIFLSLNMLFIIEDLPEFDLPIKINSFVFTKFILSFWICSVKNFGSRSSLTWWALGETIFNFLASLNYKKQPYVHNRGNTKAAHKQGRHTSDEGHICESPKYRKMRYLW